jgi:hypothetical protein
MPDNKVSPQLLIILAFLAGSLVMSLTGCVPASGNTLPFGEEATEATGVPGNHSATSAATEFAIVTAGDWPQWGGTSLRNNVPQVDPLPEQWKVGKFDRRSGAWDRSTAQNIRWVASLGNQTYGNPVVVGDNVFVGTNNASGYLARYPAEVDLGCLLCFDRWTGELRWQHSSEKLASGRVHDWPLQGICSTPLVEGDRLWFVTSRGEVCCLDTAGFYDGKDDGVTAPPEVAANPLEADVVWVYDMMTELGVSQRNMAASSVTAWGDLLLVNTGNGTGESATELPAPDAPSFICLDKQTGKLIWADSSPGNNILHGQWSSPAAGMLGGTAQAIFAGGDGYVYSFAADRGQDGKPNLLWKFDCNPKESTWSLSGDADRNYLIGTPVIYDQRVYIAVGQDPELGEGQGHLWCIDPNKRGDVSPQLAMQLVDGKPIPLEHRHPRAVDPAKGELAVDNPNSAVVWHYDSFDANGDGKIDFEETMHRTLGTVAISEDLLYVVDLAGIVHCLDARGEDGKAKVHFTFDLLSQSWSSPLIADGRVWIGDEDGDITVFELGAEHSEPVAEINMGSSLYSTPVAAGDTLFVSTRDRLFAIGFPEERKKNVVLPRP